jgi:hypothetical protein
MVTRQGREVVQLEGEGREEIIKKRILIQNNRNEVDL